MNYQHVAIYIAGDIIVSDNPGEAIKKWRLIFGLTQTAIATRLKTSPSVISDYESGRRKFPGSRFVKKFVQALIETDLERGGIVINLLERQLLKEKFWIAVLDMREFTEPVPVSNFLQAIDAEVIVSPPAGLDVHGYTIVDSVKLVLEVPSVEYVRLYGSTTQRAAIFTKVSTGRSPMIAIKSMSAVLSVKPALVVLHGIKSEAVDPLAVEIAKRSHIPLATTTMGIEKLIENLRHFK
ncbi:helix-turn-helix domain-containing protein [Pyrobaculum aerophilum]|uniref:Transcriptional regulator n=1 Tax=Pyrobaculum aerophilum TaxID=13773 RepID=A0A371QYF3_9CREN|nr:helix-turn-helix domain-containing protein [Pyrobaculum aerophilum]RFA95686.1 transcriptional regulator [Pyrobaculum aerophilum]RFB00199.1 transcriptional regulator [Pyrobaculum aerophilum]